MAMAIAQTLVVVSLGLNNQSNWMKILIDKTIY
jgi:hypothetical protein